MAEIIEIPTFEQSFKDFFEIGNWTMPTYSIFLFGCLASFYYVRIHMDIHNRFSIPFAFALTAIVFLFTFGHYRLMTLNLHKNFLIFTLTFSSMVGVFFGLAWVGRIF